jgi:hypothetical protein
VVTMCPQGRSVHTSTCAPSVPGASCHRKAGRCDVENETDTGASGLGGAGSGPASAVCVGAGDEHEPAPVSHARPTAARIRRRTAFAYYGGRCLGESCTLRALTRLMRSHRVLPFAFAFALGCNSSGTQAQGGTDSGPADATVDGATGDAADGASGDATEEGAAPCPLFTTGLPVPSTDCVYAGRCTFACNGGTASAYACNANGATALDGSVLYPSVFSSPVGIVTVVAVAPGEYPWDAQAFVSCAPLSCVRWATGDHANGGSAWPSDPCASEAGGPQQAWACPGTPGVVPPATGCASAGDFNTLGGAGTDIPANALWCCPIGDDAGATADATTDALGDASGQTDGGVPDASADGPGE